MSSQNVFPFARHVPPLPSTFFNERAFVEGYFRKTSLVPPLIRFKNMTRDFVREDSVVGHWLSRQRDTYLFYFLYTVNYPNLGFLFVFSFFFSHLLLFLSRPWLLYQVSAPLESVKSLRELMIDYCFFKITFGPVKHLTVVIIKSVSNYQKLSVFLSLTVSLFLSCLLYTSPSPRD